ncbi:hypothetical protein, partial [Streptococcus pneumoniae]|uniref:hypothetical protein n=1 Tax=Streptococcus pneumoniae TaxID=1313 RepID=UPI001E49F6C2
LWMYTCKYAKEHPKQFGGSIDFSGTYKIMSEDGTLIGYQYQENEDEDVLLGEDGKTYPYDSKRYMQLHELRACDLVDTPA